jgi:hypothetical protein
MLTNFSAILIGVCSTRSCSIVILSEAKDLLSRALPRKQVLRFSQDDKS